MDKNSSIKCVVSECKYHANQTDYCTLDQINVGRTEDCPTSSDETDCESFMVKND